MRRITNADEARAALSQGDAWREFCAELAEAGEDLLRPGAPDGDIDLAEAHRYLARMVRAGFEQIVEAGDPAMPAFFESLHPTLKSGWDNPDNVHTNAYIRGDHDYRVRATRGEAHYMTFAVYGGSLGREGGRRTVAYVDVDSLEIRSDGRFEVVLSPRKHSGNWIETAPDATTLMVRQTFWDKPRQTHASLSIERIGPDGTKAPPAPLDPLFVVNALRRTLRFVRGTNRVFFDTADPWLARPNTFFPGDSEQARSTLGIPNMHYASGWWELGPDEAIVMDLEPPRCRYWGLALCNYWGESLDYRHWQISTNARRARVRDDGSVRVVVAHRDPELQDVSWLDAAGHGAGVWNLRWLEADSHPLPVPRVVNHADLS